jgi:hypothetical protein
MARKPLMLPVVSMSEEVLEVQSPTPGHFSTLSFPNHQNRIAPKSTTGSDNA